MAEMKIAGVVLIVIAILLWFYALPVLYASTDTSTGKALENVSAPVKQSYNFMQYLFAFMPYILIAVGAGIIWKG